MKEKVNTAIKRGQQLLTSIIEKGIANKEFDPEWNASEFAIALFAMLEGGHLMSRMSGNNDNMKTIEKTLKKIISEKLI
ncbi:hypothetical protein D3C72_1262310 [compost metagenome]